MSLSPDTISTFVTKNLQSGDLGVVALTTVASAVCLPITQIKALYGISVGYGASVAAIGTVLHSTFRPAPKSLGAILVYSTIFYGFRLAGYLLLRDLTTTRFPSTGQWGPSRVKRIPFAVSLALLYACMTLPVLYVLRGAPSLSVHASAIAWMGTALAWIGAMMEAIADAHKYIVKHNTPKDHQDTFHGPTTWLYQITRHPNYTGEVFFWFGTWLAAVPFYGKSLVGWLCSTVGLYAIIEIMRRAARQLEKRHLEKYGGQDQYEKWRLQVNAPLIPFLCDD